MHCVDWIAAAKLIKKREIEAIDLDKLEFRKSNSNTDNTYAVSFGNEVDFPSCTCRDWQKRNRDSPFLKFDEPLFAEENAVFTPTKPSRDTNIVDTEYVELKELTKKLYAKRTKATICREILIQIKNLTYLIYDNEALTYLETELRSLLKAMQQHAPKDEQLILKTKKT